MDQISTLAAYSSLQQTIPHKNLVVIFGATWCSSWDDMLSWFNNELLPKYSDTVKTIYVDSDSSYDICEHESVEAIPICLFFRRTTVSEPFDRVAELKGFLPRVIEMNYKCLYGYNPDAFPTITDFLKALIMSNPVIIFITGTPSMPRCGFTSQLCKLLDSLEVQYAFYDIMVSQEICDALKKFSDWPTYPQVYANGELIGGYDICFQLEKEGKLVSELSIINSEA